MALLSAPPFSRNRLLHGLLAIYALIWIVAAIAPRDLPTWVLENILVVLFVGLLAFTYRRFAFSNLSYLLIAIFLSVHAYAAHYGYAHTPFGEWLKDALGLSRNHFDRIIHCAFGLLLAYPIREVIERLADVRGFPALWLPVAVIVAMNGTFEIIEAVAAEIVSPGTGPAWLGAQGDEWDAQFDMTAGLLGVVVAMLATWLFVKDSGTRNHPPQPSARTTTAPFRKRRFLHGLCIGYALIWIIAAIKPMDRSDWFLENILVFLSIPILVFTYRRLPLSNISYTLIFVFLMMHTTGAHYTYSEVPIGHWLKDLFELKRNHFDRLVHLSFGLLLTYPMREILARTVQPRGAWAGVFAAATIAAFSGFFEIVEGIVALVVNPSLGAAYLGTQGDIWDAQKDMALALGGALLVAVVVEWWMRAGRRTSGR